MLRFHVVYYREDIMKGYLGLVVFTLGIWSAFALMGCGVSSSPRGIVFGTTGYLQEYNRAGMVRERISERDRAELAKLVNGR